MSDDVGLVAFISRRMQEHLAREIDNAILGPPWLFHDRNPMPYFDLFPRLARAQRRIRFARLRGRARWRVVRFRIRDTIDVARHGLPEDEWT